MTGTNTFDVIIIGGSYSGLATAMALGRALKTVLIIDNGMPCNRQTPHSHNFLTNDGKTPAEIASLANLQVRRYNTVKFFEGAATSAAPTDNGFAIRVSSGEHFTATKLVFATGIRDIFPAIEGFDACWGKSVLHCPYCHGYEVRNEKTGLLSNGDMAFDFSKLVSNWTKDLTLYTNGSSHLTPEQENKLLQRKVKIVEKEITRIEHQEGYIRAIIFKDGSRAALKALYATLPFEQHCNIPHQLGCTFTDEGYIKIDSSYETSIKHVYAVGDNAAQMRTVANAVAMGTTAGMMISKKMILEEF